MVITFDHAVDRASLADHLVIDPPLAGCPLRAAFTAPAAAPCHVGWRADGASLTLLHHGAPFAPDTRYRLHLNAGLRDTAGVVNGLDHSWELTSGGAPGLRGASPPDGNAGVPLDSQPVLELSAPMDATSVVGAVELTPPVTGARVVVNPEDPSRIVLVPGRLLHPRTQYTLTLHTEARDVHGQRLRAPVTVHFATGTGLADRARALVLAGRPGEPASEVLLTATAPDAPGDPVPAFSVLEATRCTLPGGCGGVGAGAPLEGYLAAVPQPGGTRAAVVRRDLHGATPRDDLVLVDLADPTAVVAAADGVRGPTWSPDGRRLAWATATGIDVLPAVGGVPSALPSGDPPTSGPRWSGDSSHLVVVTGSADGRNRVELLEPDLGLRYPAPGLPPGADGALLSPDGTVVVADGPTGTRVAHVRTADAGPRLIGTGLRPIGFTDGATLLAVRDSSAAGPATLVRVSVASGEQNPIGPALSPAAARSLIVAPADRLLAWLDGDAAGNVQAWVANADGTGVTPLTALPIGLEARAVALGG